MHESGISNRGDVRDLILSIALGHQLAFTLAGVATLFGLIDNGFNIPGLFDLYANNVWGLMNNYTLVAVPSVHLHGPAAGPVQSRREPF